MVYIVVSSGALALVEWTEVQVFLRSKSLFFCQMFVFASCTQQKFHLSKCSASFIQISIHIMVIFLKMKSIVHSGGSMCEYWKCLICEIFICLQFNSICLNATHDFTITAAYFTSSEDSIHAIFLFEMRI